ncbi:MAG TPA: cytochrome C oxidase subunit IV family protein [Terriglobales bacterium]|nr:cytochrome C oxidase subunit IV family protein [Terriglobales bacterium]
MPEHSEHVVPKKTYYLVGAALIALMVLTAILSRVPMPGELNTLIALTIAGIKALLVLLFFMHLKYEKPPLNAVVLFAGLFWLVLLMGLSMTDYPFRAIFGVPGH